MHGVLVLQFPDPCPKETLGVGFDQESRLPQFQHLQQESSGRTASAFHFAITTSTRQIVDLTSHMAAHTQAAHNGQDYTHSAGNESQQVYFHPHQPPQHQQQLQQHQGHAPQSHFQLHSTFQPQPQPDGANAPYRHPSFIGLPPISRASTFSSLLRPFQVEGSAGDNNSTYSDAADATPRNSTQYQQQRQQQGEQQIVVATPQQTVSEIIPMATNQTAGGVEPPHGHQFTIQTPPPGQFIQSMHRPAQGPAQGQQMQIQQGQSLPNGFPSPPGTGSVPGQSPVQTQPGLPGPPGNAQGQPGSASAGAPGAPLPAMNGGAPPVAPQLTPANGRAPVMMPPPHLAGRFPQGNWNLQESHLSEPLQPTNRHRHSPSNASQQPFYGFDKETGVPASPRSQRAPDVEQQPQSQPVDQNGQGPQLDGQENSGNLIEQRPRGKSLSQANTDIDDLPAPGLIPAADGNRARRNSGIFSSLRNRVGAGTPVTSDAVSDASVMTDETGGLEQRRAQMFSALGAAAGTEAPQSKESIIAHGSTTPHQQHQPKKSRMGLKAMFSRSSQQEIHRTFVSAQSARPTMQGQPQGHHQVQQPVIMSGANPMSPLRPKTSGQVPPQQHQSLASIAESEKARKPSGGIFGMFKNKDAKSVPGNGAGQPLMDPRQTLQQGMGRGQITMPPPGQGRSPQQQQQQQQYRQQFPVGPDGKLLIFSGQLPPQHQQFMQQGHPGMHQLQQMQMQGQMLGQQRPQPNMQQSQPSLQGQNGDPQSLPQQQHQQQLDIRQGQPNGSNAIPNGPVSPPVASPAISDTQSTVEQSRPQQSTPPATNGQAPPVAPNGGHGRTFSQGSNLPSMYTLGMNGNPPNQLPVRKPVGSRVVSAQVPPSLMPQQQQRQRGASVSSAQPHPQSQSPPSSQPPSSLETQRPSDSQHTLASQGGKSLPDIPISTQRAGQESPGPQDQENQAPGRQQQQPLPMPASPQSLGQGSPSQNTPPPTPPPQEKEQSTISKFFRGTKQQISPTISQEKSKSSFMSALKRGGNTKQGESQPSRSQPRSPQANQGQFQPNQAQTQQKPQRQLGLQPPQSQLPGQPQQGQPQQPGQQQQQQESRPGLGDRRPSPHLQYQNERQDPSKAPSPPAQADLAVRPPAQQPSQQPTRPPVTSAPGAAPNQSRPAPQMIQQPQQMVQGQPGPAPGLVQGQRPPVPGQPMHPNQMAAGQVQAQAQVFAQQQFFHTQAQAHAQAQMFQRFQQHQAQLAAQGQAQQRPGQPPNQDQNPATSGPPGQEQRYAQVPIPAGYGFVQQGMATPSPMGMPMPYFINVPGQPPQGYFMPMPGQMMPPPGMPGMPQMLPPGFVPGQPFMYAPHPGGPMPPGSMPPGPPGNVPMVSPPGSVPMATPPSAGTPTPIFTPPASQGGPQPVFHVPVHPSSPPPGSEHSAQHPPSISPTPPPFIGTARQASNISPQPQLQQSQQPPPQPSRSPPNHPLPNTSFSPVNPDAVNAPNPPLPASEPQQQLQQQPNPGLIPQRQVSQVSAMSLQPSNGSPSINVISPISNDSGVTLMPEGQQQLSRSGSAAAFPPDTRTVSPEPVNVAQRLLGSRIDEDMDNGHHDDKGLDNKKGDNHDDHDDHHHQWNGIAATDSVTHSRAISPEPTFLDEHLHGPMTPPPTTVSFIRAQAQEVHVHRSPDRHVGENNIYDATPRQSIKSPVLSQRRDSIEEEDGYGFPKTEKEDSASIGKNVDGLSDIREESPETGNCHFIVAPVDDLHHEVEKAAEPTAAHPAPVKNGDVHHGEVVGSSKDETEELVIPGQVHKPQLHQPTEPEAPNGVIATASGFLIAPSPSNSPPTDPSNPKGIVKPLTDRSIFEEAKRKQLLREQEEKIPVFSDDDNINGGGMDQNGAAAAGGKKKGEEEDAVPMMSATSYPGQEWNPYDFGGEGGEGWED
ncbi:hypothetical protein QBC32DRAFT_269638 [Pseudoneurospora amorphoporcata]|uniref:Uncharacterized protein n=1 Tax=Pseudoneurospora amorphoporcata TaxID=241081 RepID=A0AAN6SC00_9PEZI|nr:hypothetical protein QBC32DRAFT_269638 [Pseudoneurospora amorphoporcata]